VPRQTIFFIVCLSLIGTLGLGSILTLPRPATAEIRNADARVVSNPQTVAGTTQFIIRLSGSGARYLVKTRPYPAFRYGDILTVTGTVTAYGGTYGGYLKSRRVAGVAAYPDMRRTGAAPPTLKDLLYRMRNAFGDALARVLPMDEAALANGITLGGYGGFSSSLLQAMQRSGTTHLVALSGYNVAIVCSIVIGLCTLFLKKRAALVTALTVLALFVVMTGAESSVVRAALMGGVAALAGLSARKSEAKNVIAATALLMLVPNPYLLCFDTGFQLSFLALIGIICLRPHIGKLLHAGRKGFLSWRENLATTAAAQCAVLPLILIRFSAFPVTALLTNVAVLSFIPAAMLLSFITALTALASPALALIPGFVLHLILSAVIAIIRLFG